MKFPEAGLLRVEQKTSRVGAQFQHPLQTATRSAKERMALHHQEP
jgi:hypothetical protein